MTENLLLKKLTEEAMREILKGKTVLSEIDLSSLAYIHDHKLDMISRQMIEINMKFNEVNLNLALCSENLKLVRDRLDKLDSDKETMLSTTFIVKNGQPIPLKPSKATEAELDRLFEDPL